MWFRLCSGGILGRHPHPNGLLLSSGARISLTREVYADDILRIINLNNYFEADFRVVGPARTDGTRVAEWGVEVTQKGRSIWDIDFLSPPNLPEEEGNGTWLACRSCGESVPRELSPMEQEVLNLTGIIAASRSRCEKPTYWTYAEAARQPKRYPPFPAVAPASLGSAHQEVREHAGTPPIDAGPSNPASVPTRCYGNCPNGKCLRRGLWSDSFSRLGSR